jgi:hypothetical protein
MSVCRIQERRNAIGEGRVLWVRAHVVQRDGGQDHACISCKKSLSVFWTDAYENFRRTNKIRYKKEYILRVRLLRREVKSNCGINDVDVLGYAPASTRDSIKRGVVVFRHETRVNAVGTAGETTRLGVKRVGPSMTEWG